MNKFLGTARLALFSVNSLVSNKLASASTEEKATILYRLKVLFHMDKWSRAMIFLKCSNLSAYSPVNLFAPKHTPLGKWEKMVPTAGFFSDFDKTWHWFYLWAGTAQNLFSISATSERLLLLRSIRYLVESH